MSEIKRGASELFALASAAHIRAMGMEAENDIRRHRGEAPAYAEQPFAELATMIEMKIAYVREMVEPEAESGERVVKVKPCTNLTSAVTRWAIDCPEGGSVSVSPVDGMHLFGKPGAYAIRDVSDQAAVPDCAPCVFNTEGVCASGGKCPEKEGAE